jgi:FixJ family two-component response regulator
MADKVLFVDDEPAFLAVYRLILSSHFDIDTAVGGEQGLAAIRNHGPYAVVVSDMRMPGMNGARFLARVREDAPEATRMMLTGCGDIDAAVDAVNKGNVFRFLTKPCGEDVLRQTVADGVAQYRLVTAEKDLLENTLIGSIKVLTDVLAAIRPEAFGKSIRITRCVRHLMARFHIPSLWCFEAAAMLSQLGCIVLDPELIQSAYVDTHLSAENRVRFEAHPKAASDLLVNVRRLEPVAWIIAQQLTRENLNDPPEIPELPAAILRLGAKMLRAAGCLRQLKNERSIQRRIRAASPLPLGVRPGSGRCPGGHENRGVDNAAATNSNLGPHRGNDLAAEYKKSCRSIGRRQGTRSHSPASDQA